MKSAYAFLAALLLVEASAIILSCYNEEGELNDLDHDFKDFCELIPKEDLERLIGIYLGDSGFVEVFKYITSNDFHKLMYAVEELPEFHRYILYLQVAGFNVIRELRFAHKLLGMKDFLPLETRTHKVMTNVMKGGGFDAFYDDIIAMLPKQEIKALHDKKVKESSAFAKFKNAVTSPKFFEITMALHFQDPMLALIQQTRAHGFDLQKYYSFRSQLIGLAS